MNCVKCKRQIPEDSNYCLYCGKKQTVTKRKTRKRAKGTGTIYRNNSYHRPWLAYAPSTLSGRNRVYVGSFATVAEAQTAIENYISQKAPDRYNYTLKQIYDEWSSIHFQTLTVSGEQGYKAAYLYLSDLHGRRIRELKTADYQKCIDACAEKFSRSQCEKVKQLCSQLCKYSMQNDIIDKNYAQFIKLPKAQKVEREIFTDEELALLWEHKDDECVQIILVLCYTGFRIGELFAVEKKNVHLSERFIVGGMKTEAGTDRTVPISDKIFEFIFRWYNSSTNEKLINKDPSNFRKREFYPKLRELGMIDSDPKAKPRLTPHCTRHTFATLCQRAGIKPEELQKIIGHAKYETTADIYIHEDVSALKSAIAKL